MGIGLPRFALWALVVLLLAGSLATVAGAQAGSTPNYTLLGTAEQPNATPVPAGVNVDLISAASHTTYTTQTTGNSGSFSFSNAAGGNTASALAPGWWGVWVPPQSHVKATGCNPCAVLPANQNATYYWLNSSDLTTSSFRVTLSGVNTLPYTQTINGTVTLGSTGKPLAGASVLLLDPQFNGFVIANNTTSSAGYYTLQIPSGNWVLQTIAPGAPNPSTGQGLFNYTPVDPASKTVNPVLGNYLTYGWVNLASAPAVHVPNGGNVTLIDTANGYIYSQPTSGAFFSIGTYPAGFTTHAAQPFDVVLSTVGYGTVWYPLNASFVNPSGTPNPHYVYTAPQTPPAAYSTILNFTKGFGLVSISTASLLKNDSTFPDLPNASVGQLWAQLALDWQHNTTFNAANLPTVYNWVNSSGPFLPAGEAQLMIDSSIGFNQTTNYTFTHSTNCLTFCGLSSSAALRLNWSQVYLSNGTVSSSAKTHTFAFTFRHPTNYQSFNYTVVLPAGFVLSAGSASSAPAQTRLSPAGPGGTWTSFTLVSQPSSGSSATASFTAVKVGGVVPAVNVSAPNFAFSSRNVLNSSHNNYTVVVGVKQNVTFSALNSTFPAGTNGTAYQWVFGDGTAWVNSTKATTSHTFALPAKYSGSLKVTSSGGLSNTTTFFVYATATSPTAIISVNATALQSNTTSAGTKYVTVPSGTTLHFNASGSLSTLPGTGSPPGVLSIASWNVSTAKNTWLANYSRGAGANPLSNDTLSFLGAGYYLTQGIVNGTLVPIFGWQYNVTLTVWDGGGHKATAQLVVLVKDHEKPISVPGALDSRGRTVSSAGVVEGPNHKALVYLWANGSSDPHNGSITWYNWTITNKGNASVHGWNNTSAVMPGYKVPPKFGLWLDPQSKPYTANLTVTDRAGNKAFSLVSVTVAVNTSTRPVLSVGNLTAPSTMTDGSSYTVWVNVSNTIGKNSTAANVSVAFYLLPPSGSGSPINIGGSPGSVTFYSYDASGHVNQSLGTGKVSVKYNQTVRAVISFNPARQGTYDLWANATASNEFGSNYAAGGNQAHVRIALNANPIVQDEEWAAIAIVAIAVIIGLVLFMRNRGRKTTTKSSSGRSGSDRASKKSEPDDDEDDE